MQQLKCSKCKLLKEENDFSKDKGRTTTGHRSSCKSCDKKYREDNKEKELRRHAIYRKAHRQELRDKNKIYYQENREKCLERSKRNNKIYNAIHKEEIARKQRLRRLKKKAKLLKLKQCHICKEYVSAENSIDAGTLYCRPCYAKASNFDEYQTSVFCRLKTTMVKVDDTLENKKKREYAQKRKEKTLEEIAFSKFGM